MKNTILLAMFATIFTTVAFCQDKAILSATELKYDWGVVYSGEKVQHEFTFINKGNIPLIIFDASASCGCTVPTAPTKPILPGETGSVKVVFDSKGRVEQQNKSVTVKANTEPEYTTFYLSGMVYNKPTVKRLSIEEQIALKKKKKEEERIAKEKAELAKIEAERKEQERLYLEQEEKKKKKIKANRKKLENTTQKTDVEKELKNEPAKIETVDKSIENTYESSADSTIIQPKAIIVNKNDKNYKERLKSFFNIGNSNDDE